MSHNEKFEDEGFVYELVVNASDHQPESLFVISQGVGYCCHWFITGKESQETREVAVTDDNCELVVFQSVDAAVKGARQFLSL